jgi:hypothetical protein
MANEANRFHHPHRRHRRRKSDLTPIWQSLNRPHRRRHRLVKRRFFARR